MLLHRWHVLSHTHMCSLTGFLPIYRSLFTYILSSYYRRTIVDILEYQLTVRHE